MKYMIFQLFSEKYISDVLMAIAEAGVEDTVVLSGEATSHKLIFDNPLFSSFRSSYNSNLGYGKIIMGFCDIDQVDYMLKELKRAGIDIIGKKLGRVVLIKPSQIYE